MFDVKEHFPAPQWVDLVRGQLSEEGASEMDGHIRAGCSVCVAAFDAWQGLAAFAREERELTPPPEAVRVAKSYLATEDVARPVETATGPVAAWASATLATLVFDSLQAAPAGARAAGTLSRHLVFDAKSLVIDLHIDTGARSQWCVLSGQIVDSRHPEEPMKNVWLSLVDERQEVNMFQTNEFGEFRCTFDRQRALKLMVYASRSVIAIPLETLLTPTDEAGPREH